MHDGRFFDQALTLIELGHVASAMNMLNGQLYRAFQDESTWNQTRETLRNHPLRAALLEDPYVGRAAAKPLGYAGDAVMIDFIYDQLPPDGISKRAQEMFLCSTNVQAAQGVRLRREYAVSLLSDAVHNQKKTCVLACGHLREADTLAGFDLSNIVAVDQDAASIAGVRRQFGENITLAEANVFEYLKSAFASGQKFDLIYTLGLTDYLDDNLLRVLIRLSKACLADDGVIIIANFLPNHMAVGMMDAVMDWHLICRTEADLAAVADDNGLASKTWTDATASIAWCEMRHPAI